VSSRLPSNALVWFGVLGGATAWVVQFVVNLAFTFAQCNQRTTRWILPVHSWEVALSAVAVAVGLSSTAVALWVFLRTYRIDDVARHERQGDGVAPPLGRVSFLSMIGLLVNALVLMIMIMTGVGAPLLPVCQQS
jgi:hypothetical protein